MEKGKVVEIKILRFEKKKKKKAWFRKPRERDIIEGYISHSTHRK